MAKPALKRAAAAGRKAAVKRGGKRASGPAARRFDRAAIERGVKLVLEGIGADLKRDGLTGTPRRVCDFYEEQLGGMWEDAASPLQPMRTGYDHDMVIVKNIRFASMCEHHLLPFIGTVGVAYVPRGGRVVGISKIVRTVNAVARRLQIQERMTSQIADAIAARLRPAGVLVVVEAEHLCMTIRGVRKPGALVVTTEARGILRRPERQAPAAAAISRQ